MDNPLFCSLTRLGPLRSPSGLIINGLISRDSNIWADFSSSKHYLSLRLLV